jgi:PAS domain S-box-containing protein
MAFLACGWQVWPGIVASAFVVAVSSVVPPLAAAGQAVGATAGALTAAHLLRRLHFDPTLSRLGDALGLIILGAFGSAMVSASIGIFSLYATGVQAYSGIETAWLIYWLGDSTGVLLVTPLVFTLPDLFAIRPGVRLARLAALLTVVTAACFVVFGDLPLIPVRLHVLAFAVLPFVMWAAIDFGVGGASLSVFLIATFATLATAFGLGPFAGNSSFINAVLLDVLFAVLAVSGLTLAAVVSERERVKSERERLIREQTGIEARLRLAAIVESSDDAIVSKDLDGIVLSWNLAAERIFGFTAAETVGQPATMLLPAERRDEERRLLQRLKAGERIERHKSIRVAKSGARVDVSLTMSPLMDSAGELVGAAEIARDITEQQHAEEALSTLSRRLLQAQERERARIARELHDDIGQRLALLSMELSELSSGPVGLYHRSVTSRIQKQASEIAVDVHGLSHDLHSSKLELLGLTTAVKGFCREFADQKRVDVDFAAHDVPDELAADVSLCLFRVLQEALHNSAKHSGVRTFYVRLWGTGDEIHLMVSDPGAGFDLELARTGRGLGLISMEERLKLVDGLLSIDTDPQRGTKVHARAPFRSTATLPGGS